MTTYAPCDSAGPKCTGSGASEGGTTVHPLIVSIAGEPKGHGGPTPVAALAALLHRGLLFRLGCRWRPTRWRRSRPGGELTLIEAVGRAGPDFLVFCRSSPVGDVWRDLI